MGQTIGILSLDRWVGSRLEAEMKLQKEKQVAVPKIEIDLSKIQQLSHERDEENWEFRITRPPEARNRGAPLSLPTLPSPAYN